MTIYPYSLYYIKYCRPCKNSCDYYHYYITVILLCWSFEGHQQGLALGGSLLRPGSGSFIDEAVGAWSPVQPPCLNAPTWGENHCMSV